MLPGELEPTPTTFAVAIPTHNRRETVVLAALSALRQTRPPEQLLVLCDGCTDGTGDAIRGLGDARAIVVELPKGSGFAYEHRNRAFELTTADVILWLADDDLLLPDHLEQLGRLWDTGTVDIVTSPAIIVHPDDTLEWIGADWSLPSARAWMQRENTNVMASVSVRTQLARDVGGWDPAPQRGGDWHLWRRVLATGARAADTGEPTVLHFRATGRVQLWPDRVVQNTRWLERISAPSPPLELRNALRQARAAREATLIEAVAPLRETVANLEARQAELERSRWWRLGEKLRPAWRTMRRFLWKDGTGREHRG